MREFVDAVSAAVANENWYAAIGLSLALPDICGRLTDPQIATGARYEQWWSQYVEARYTFRGTVFLGGGDAYALRCAFLHEGRDDVAEQRARQAISRFRFISPSPIGMIHCNTLNDTLQLQTDIFCRDVCDGVEAWLVATIDNADIRERSKGLLSIEDGKTRPFGI